MIESWMRSASSIRSGLFSHVWVDPSTSVKRNVTVPVGRTTLSGGSIETSLSRELVIGDANAVGDGTASTLSVVCRRRALGLESLAFALVT